MVRAQAPLAAAFHGVDPIIHMRNAEVLFWRGSFIVVALLVGGFAGCSTLQSIAVCGNAAGEYENENENENENEYLLIW